MTLLSALVAHVYFFRKDISNYFFLGGGSSRRNIQFKRCVCWKGNDKTKTSFVSLNLMKNGVFKVGGPLQFATFM